MTPSGHPADGWLSFGLAFVSGELRRNFGQTAAFLRCDELDDSDIQGVSR